MVAKHLEHTLKIPGWTGAVSLNLRGLPWLWVIAFSFAILQMRQGQSEFVLVTRKTPGLKSFEILKVRLKFPARHSIKVWLQVWHNPEGKWALAVV